MGISDFQKGTLSDTFSAMSAKLKVETNRDLEMSHQEGLLEEVGRIEIGQSKTKDKTQTEARKKKQQELITLIQLEQIRLQLLEQIERLQEEINELLAKRDETAQDIEALDSYLLDYRKTGQFAVDATGKPTNPLVKKVVEEWELDTGRKFDPYSDETDNVIRELLRDKQAAYDAYSDIITNKNNELESLIEDLDTVTKLKSNSEAYDALNQEEILHLTNISNALNDLSKPQREPENIKHNIDMGFAPIP